VRVGVSFGTGVSARVKVRLRTCVRAAAMAEGARSEASSSRRPAAMLSSGRWVRACSASITPNLWLGTVVNGKVRIAVGWG
jgi:hypothetical protein